MLQNLSLTTQLHFCTKEKLIRILIIGGRKFMIVHCIIGKKCPPPLRINSYLCDN